MWKTIYFDRFILHLVHVTITWCFTKIPTISTATNVHLIRWSSQKVRLSSHLGYRSSLNFLIYNDFLSYSLSKFINHCFRFPKMGLYIKEINPSSPKMRRTIIKTFEAEVIFTVFSLTLNKSSEVKNLCNESAEYYFLLIF